MALFFAFGSELDRAKLLTVILSNPLPETTAEQPSVDAGRASAEANCADTLKAAARVDGNPPPPSPSDIQARLRDYATRQPVAIGCAQDTALVFRKRSDDVRDPTSDLTPLAGARAWGLVFDLPDETIAAMSDAYDSEERIGATRRIVIERLVANTGNTADAAQGARIEAGTEIDVHYLACKRKDAPLEQPESHTVRRLLRCCLELDAPLATLRAILGSDPTSVQQLAKDGADLTGQKVTELYYKAPPRFAIYQTADRVMVQYSDDCATANLQRAAMAVLNPARSQITGLIDGWQKSSFVAFKQRASRYNSRVAASLNQLLEGDSTSAQTTIEAIKEDVAAERASWGRFEYLLGALAVAVAFCTVFWLLKAFVFTEGNPTHLLWLATRAGTVGAFFSIAINIQQRRIQTDLNLRDNLADSALRITVGAIGAGALFCLLQSGLLPLSALGAGQKAGTDMTWQVILVIGFLAGFTERLVPNIMDKMANSAAPDSPAPTNKPVAAPKPS